MIDARRRLHLQRRHLAGLAAPVAVAILIAGCGNSASATSGQATNTTTSPPAVASDRALTVTTTEFAFRPVTLTANAGKLKLTLVNHGKAAHELVVLKTEQAAGSLNVKAGRVSETDAVGEVSETAAGSTRSTTLTLGRGHYVFVCNIPGHYADGMRGTLTVR